MPRKPRSDRWSLDEVRNSVITSFLSTAMRFLFDCLRDLI